MLRIKQHSVPLIEQMAMVMIRVDQLGAYTWRKEGGPRRTRSRVLGCGSRRTLDLAHPGSAPSCHLVLHPGANLIRLLVARGRASHQPTRFQEAS